MPSWGVGTGTASSGAEEEYPEAELADPVPRRDRRGPPRPPRPPRLPSGKAGSAAHRPGHHRREIHEPRLAWICVSTSAASNAVA